MSLEDLRVGEPSINLLNIPGIVVGFPTATFGAGGKKSRAVFKVPSSKQEDFKTSNQISFFFRTRAADGGIMHIYGNSTESG